MGLQLGAQKHAENMCRTNGNQPARWLDQWKPTSKMVSNHEKGTSEKQQSQFYFTTGSLLQKHEFRRESSARKAV
jgi:hypothetical protein